MILTFYDKSEKLCLFDNEKTNVFVSLEKICRHCFLLRRPILVITKCMISKGPSPTHDAINFIRNMNSLSGMSANSINHSERTQVYHDDHLFNLYIRRTN